MEEYAGYFNPIERRLERMAMSAVDRSCGRLVRFSVAYFATDELLAYVAERLKIDTDVACRAHGITSLGIIVRDQGGDVLLAEGMNVNQMLESQVGEALAIRLGLDMAKSVGMDRLIIESDGREIVGMISAGVTTRKSSR